MERKWKLKVFVSTLGAVMAAFAGAYANHEFAMKRASVNAIEQTHTISELSRKAVLQSESIKGSDGLNKTLVKISQLATSVEANLRRVNSKAGNVDQISDLWLARGEGLVLGQTTTFGLENNRIAGGLNVRKDGKRYYLVAGDRINYTTKQGEECFISLVGKASNEDLYGFNLVCGS